MARKPWNLLQHKRRLSRILPLRTVHKLIERRLIPPRLRRTGRTLQRVLRGTRIPVQLVADMLGQGATPEEIVEGYPALRSRWSNLHPYMFKRILGAAVRWPGPGQKQSPYPAPSVDVRWQDLIEIPD